MSSGLFELEINLGILLIPLGLTLSKINYYESFPRLFRSFTDGLLMSVFLALLNSFILLIEGKGISSFTYSEVAFFHHPSYLSMYCGFAVALLYYNKFHPTKHTYMKPWTSTFLIVVFSIYSILLISKAGLIFMFLAHIFSLAFWIRKHHKIREGVIAIAIILFGATASITFIKPIQERFNELFFLTTSKEINAHSSSGVRIIAWESSINLINSAPILGQGTGDVSQALTDNFISEGHHHLAFKSLNSHNQFLQTAVKNGVIGLISLILILLQPYFIAKKNKINSTLFIVFLTLISYNFLTESILQKQSGIIFFAFFNSLFLLSFINQLNNKAKDY